MDYGYNEDHFRLHKHTFVKTSKSPTDDLKTRKYTKDIVENLFQ